MNVYTKQDLTIMQAWSLERKIKVTQTKILEWYYHYGGKVFVSLSGGKDSTVLLDLARRAFLDIKAAFVDTGLEYPEVRSFVKTISDVEWLRPTMPFNTVIEKYGYPVISKEVAKRIYYARHGSDWAINHLNGLMKDGTPSEYNKRYMKYRYIVEQSDFPISEHCCEVMKKRPLANYTKKSGLMPIIGTMASESIRRQSAYLQSGCNGFHKKYPSSQPLAFWTEQNVLEYLKMTEIPYASIYGNIVCENGKFRTTGVQRTGCMFCMFGVHLEKSPNRFQKMEITHPKQHNYCINKLGCGKVLDFFNIPYKMSTVK